MTDSAAVDTYRALAPIYDWWQEHYGAFWRRVFPRLVATFDVFGPLPAPRSFADLGCGTGELLLALRGLHPDWSFCGVEQSPAMLSMATAKPDASAVRWVCGSFEEPFGDANFAAAGSFFDALNHAATPGALERTFAAVARSLTSGGLFVFDLNNRDGFDAWWRGRRRYDGPGWTLLMDASFDEKNGLAHGRAVVERGSDGERQSNDVVERCFDDAHVLGALKDAGFTVEGAEPWSPLPGDVAGKTWWVARRK